MKTQNQTVTLRLLLFAQYRELLGDRERRVDVAAGTTPRALLARLSSGNPRLEALQPVVRFLINSEFVSGDEPLRDGDELAFVPPVAGG